jgi:hypothetical protein
MTSWKQIQSLVPHSAPTVDWAACLEAFRNWSWPRPRRKTRSTMPKAMSGRIRRWW